LKFLANVRIASEDIHQPVLWLGRLNSGGYVVENAGSGTIQLAFPAVEVIAPGQVLSSVLGQRQRGDEIKFTVNEAQKAF